MVLAEADVLTEAMHKPGFGSESDHDMMVVLVTNLTEALIEEGFVREVISKVQTMRKEADFDVTDRITIGYATTDKLSAIIEKGAADIQAATLATAVTCGELADAYAKDWNINGEKATLWVKKN